MNVGDNYNRPKVPDRTSSRPERIGTIIGDRKQPERVTSKKLPLSTERLIESTTQMRGHTSCPQQWGEDMVLLRGIVERNSLSGNWIASLDREVIKKSGL